MRDTQGVARFAPPTPRSRRLGRELRRLREERGLTLEQAGREINMTGARISRVELGDIKISAGGVIELLRAYGVDLDSPEAQEMVAEAQAMRREAGWWQRIGLLPSRFATYIAYEDEASDLLNFEPNLIPGLLQTPEYAQAVFSDPSGGPVDEDATEGRVKARIKRQEVLSREGKGRLRLHAIISEAALLTEVGGRNVRRDQLAHLVTTASRPNIRVQVLRFAAGAALANNGGFAILRFAKDPELGYVDTLAGPLFLEATDDIARLMGVFDNLKTLALSPAESIDYIRARARERGTEVDQG